jgi:hypothetical protein
LACHRGIVKYKHGKGKLAEKGDGERRQKENK